MSTNIKELERLAKLNSKKHIKDNKDAEEKYENICKRRENEKNNKPETLIFFLKLLAAIFVITLIPLNYNYFTFKMDLDDKLTKYLNSNEKAVNVLNTLNLDVVTSDFNVDGNRLLPCILSSEEILFVDYLSDASCLFGMNDRTDHNNNIFDTPILTYYTDVDFITLKRDSKNQWLVYASPSRKTLASFNDYVSKIQQIISSLNKKALLLKTWEEK